MDRSVAKSIYFKELSSCYKESELESMWRMLLEFSFFGSGPKILERQVLELIQRLKEREPIQYIIGKCFFYDSEFYVDSSVLIPRPETEELVDLILRDFRSHNDSLNIIDLGTGSGCIPIILKKHLPQSKVIGLDISEEALQIATKNADVLQLDVEFVQGDILEMEDLAGTYDIIVSNPPYIPPSEKEKMGVGVLAYEPHLALFSSQDNPLEFYIKIAQLAQSHLKPQGRLYFECNEFSAAELENWLNKEFEEVELLMDMQGKPRMMRITQ